MSPPGWKVLMKKHKSQRNMKKIVHVNQHVIKRNKKTGERKPVLTIKTYKSNNYAHEAHINGPCKVIYRPDKPLSCGAQVWIETQSEVIPLTKPEVENEQII